MMKLKILSITATAIALSAVGGGFAANPSAGNDGEEVREIEAVRSAPISLTQAIATAETESGGIAVSAEAEEKGSHVLYEIMTIGGGKVVEFQVDPQTGDVVETEVVEEDADEYAGVAQLETSLSSAIASAEQATGGKAIEAGFDDEDGKTLYEVELAAADGTIHKVNIDAASGEVARATGDDNGKQKDE